MSAWLVDTHALLWFLDDDPRLSQTGRDAIEAPGGRVLVSAASVWEMAIKANQRKLDVPESILAQMEREGFEQLPVTAAHAWRTATFPADEHKDPFDRLLAAQALIEDVPIISADADLDRYGVKRHW